jgi:hypothetical protein
MISRPLSKKEYSLLLEADKKVYPTSNPVTPKILDEWFQNNPEFGIVFEENKKVQGILVIIPLNKKGWNKLISGELAEADLNKETIFDNNKDKEIGLHCYHIEKFDKSVPNFYKESLDALEKIVKALRKSNPSLKVCGFSALCVTSEGIGLFHNKLNCRERDFINSENILKKEDKIEIFNTSSQKELDKKLEEGYEYVNRCKMLVTYPEEVSIAWKYLK